MLKLVEKKETIVLLAVLFVLSAVAAAPLFSTGAWFYSHEATDQLQRVMAMGHEVQNGQWYPRWLSLSYGGKGSPFANFYSPGFYLAATMLYLLGVPLLVSLKVVLSALFFVGAAGMFFWTRRHFGVWGGFLAAVLYLFAPYHFVDLYVRGAVAEFTALAFLPFLFWGIDLVFAEGSTRCGVLLVALACAAIVLSHNLSALMIGIFAAPYVAVAAWRCRSARKLAAACLGPLLGAGLSAFYWLPVLVDRKALRGMDAAVTSGYYSYTNHFVYFRQLFSTFWGFGSSVEGPNDEMSFQIGTAILLLGVLALALLPWATRGKRAFPLTVALLGGLAAAFTTEALAPAYGAIHSLALVQFPWRFLGPTSLFLSALGGFAPAALAGGRLPRQLPPLLGVAGVVLCLILSIEHRALVELPGPEMMNTAQGRRTLVEQHLVGALCQADEYLPVAVTPAAQKLTLAGEPAPVSAAARFSRLAVHGSSMEFGAEAGGAGATVRIPWFYFPGWQVTVDGAPVAAAADRDGFLSFALPAGAHAVRVRFGSTPLRSAAWCLAAGTALLVILAVAGEARCGRGKGRGDA